MQVRLGVNKYTDPGCFYKGQEPVIQSEQLPCTYVTALSQKKVPFLRGKKVPSNVSENELVHKAPCHRPSMGVAHSSLWGLVRVSFREMVITL